MILVMPRAEADAILFVIFAIAHCFAVQPRLGTGLHIAMSLHNMLYPDELFRLVQCR